jgi:hypothetical protein
MDIEPIQERITKGDYLFTQHAVKRMTERRITRHEVEEAVGNGEIIEEYPDDKYGPSCLIYGVTQAEKILHVQASHVPRVKIITVYEPTPDEWEDGKVRKRNE